MSNKVFEVRDVVCDYGVFENGELKLICNSRRIADMICSLMIFDEEYHKALNSNMIPVNEVYRFAEDEAEEENQNEWFNFTY